MGTVALMMLAGAVAQAPTTADGASKGGPGEPSGGFVADVRAFLGEYQVALGEGPGKPAELHKEPVLKYSSDLDGSFVGAVFVWTAEGRPEVISTVFKPARSTNKALEHEMLSLATGKLSARRDDRVVWTPAKPGVELKPIPDAAKPADSPAQRSIQMRALAREFAARTSIPVDPRPLTELRLLTQPIHRYASTSPEVLDGAVFAFVGATDPEALLLIEARKAEGGYRWCYAPARMSALTLALRHKEGEVWSVPYCWNQIRERDAAFTRFFRVVPKGP